MDLLSAFALEIKWAFSKAWSGGSMFLNLLGVIMKLSTNGVLFPFLNRGELLSIELSVLSLLNSLAGDVLPKSSAKVYLKF